MSWNIPEIVEAIMAKHAKRGTPSDQFDYLRQYHTAALKEFYTKYQSRFSEAELRGMGGSGTVIKLSGPKIPIPGEATVVPKCLKYPHPCIGLPGNFKLTEVIDNEAKMLGQINHPHIMPLEEAVYIDIEDASINERDRRVPAYLMPFIESAELGDFLLNPEATAEQMIKLLGEAAEALSYLHSLELIHLDIKPGNILVANDGPTGPRALVSDFGFCKRLVVNSVGQTLVMGTDGYMDPDLLSLMVEPTTSNENRVRDRVPRNKLIPQFDRYAFGATILDSISTFLDVKQPDGSPRTIPTGLMRGLLFVALRCSGRNPGAMRVHARYPNRKIIAPDKLFQREIADAFAYKAVTDLKEDLSRLEGNRSAFLEPEIAETTGEAICLPDRMFAPLSRRVVQTLDSLPIRRLATISQLALCYHVYPGASHTRKEHVVGTYRTACHLVRQLILDPLNPIGAMILKPRQQRLAMLSSMLHDMAHMPLMHEFEDSIPELSQPVITSELIGGELGGDTYSQELRALLKEWDVTLDELRLVLGADDKVPPKFGGEGTQREVKERWKNEWNRPDLQLIRSVVDSSVDADKIDYLQRDSLHVGVRFGHGVERERIETQVTTIIKSEGSGDPKMKVRCRMGVWRKGQAAAESLIGVRHSMYSQVYAHRTVRAARAMLNYVAWKWRISERYQGVNGEDISRELFAFATSLEPKKRLTPLLQPDPVDLIHAIHPQVTDNLPWSDSRVIRWMAFVSGDESARAMAEALISRRLYKKVCSLDRNDVGEFGKLAFPKKEKVYLPPKLTAKQWLALVGHLSFQMDGFLSNGGTSAIVAIGSNSLPPLLLDIAIPKTMRMQGQLDILRDLLAGDVTWKRVSRLDAERTDIIPGTIAKTSPVYEAYGGGSDDSLDPISIRLFARRDIAASLRPLVDPTTVASWLEAFRPEEDTAEKTVH